MSTTSGAAGPRLTHGASAYKTGRCRCDVCREAGTRQTRAWAERTRPKLAAYEVFPGPTLSQIYPGEMLPVKAVRLTRGFVAIVDPEDAWLVDSCKWHVVQVPHGASLHAADSRRILLHQQLTGYPVTDHANRDGLDNRRCNLRPATASLNAANKGLTSANTSGYKGVSWANSGWQACITVNGEKRFLGRFSTPEEAAKAYDRAAVDSFREYAYLNFRDNR